MQVLPCPILELLCCLYRRVLLWVFLGSWCHIWYGIGRGCDPFLSFGTTYSSRYFGDFLSLLLCLSVPKCSCRLVTLLPPWRRTLFSRFKSENDLWVQEGPPRWPHSEASPAIDQELDDLMSSLCDNKLLQNVFRCEHQRGVFSIRSRG